MVKIKTYSVTKDVTDSMGRIYKIFVYGEVTEENALDGVELCRVRYQHGSGEVVAREKEKLILPLGDNCSPTKKLNFGYAICAPEDDFNEEKGIEVAKKRFSRAPITTQDCRFLKKDMVEAILNQTAEYVATHEFKETLKKKAQRERIFNNFRDGEIVKIGTAFDDACPVVGAISLKDGNVGFYWCAYTDSDWVSFVERKNYDIYFWNDIEKISAEDKEKIVNLLKTKYHNQWDEENKKYVKA